MLRFAGSVAIICVCSIAAAAAAVDAPNREAARASDTRHATRGDTRSTRRNAISNDVEETPPDNVFADTTRTQLNRRPNNAATAAIIAHRDDTATATSSTHQHLQKQQQHHTTNGEEDGQRGDIYDARRGSASPDFVPDYFLVLVKSGSCKLFRSEASIAKLILNR